MMRDIRTGLVAAALAAAFAAAPVAAAEFITIGGGPSGGTYYAISTGMAKIFNEQLKDVEARVRATNGAAENPVLASAGQIDLGPTNANLAVWALEGTEVYEGQQQENIALFMGGLAGGSLHVAVQAASDIESIEDLAGKRIAVGPQGNTTALMMNQLLQEYGLAPNDYSPVFVNYNDGFAQLADGNVDAAIINTAPPVTALQELGMRTDFRLLPVAEDKRASFLEKNPFYAERVIKAATYESLSEDVPTIGSQNIVIVRKDMDPDLVYDMVKAIYENLDVLHDAHPSARVIKVETGTEGGLPLHPGAERYFREAGVLK